MVHSGAPAPERARSHRKSPPSDRPTGRPPPSTASRPARRAPARRPRAAQRGHQHRASAPASRRRRSSRATAPTPGTATASTPSAPPLASRPGTPRISRASSAPVPETSSGGPASRRRPALVACPARRVTQPQERAGQRGQRDRQHRRAAAVHADRGDRLAGELLDGRRSCYLQRVVRAPVVLDRPAGRHAGDAASPACLPEQFM